MAKPSVTLRSGKGSALTYSELDTNFTNLKDATVSLTAGSGGTAVTADLNGNITLVAGTGVTLSGDNTAKTLTINSSSGLTDIVNDTTPQLGGNLDVNGQSIVSASNGNISIAPNGTGQIIMTSEVIKSNTTDFRLVGDMTGSQSVSLKFIDNTPSENLLGDIIVNENRMRISYLQAGEVQINADKLAINNLGGSTPAITVNATSGTPSNTSTVNGWITILVNGVTKYIPFYA
jgi:hypothetical protein